MQELINKVMNAAGISEDQARKSIETVSGYLKDRMPQSFRSQIDNLINGGKLSEGIKSKLTETGGELKDKAEDVIRDVREKADEVADKIRDMFSEKEKK